MEDKLSVNTIKKKADEIVGIIEIYNKMPMIQIRGQRFCLPG